MTNSMDAYIRKLKALSDDALEKWDVAVLENPTNIGKEELVRHLVNRYGRTLLVSQSYDINRQWNNTPDITDDMVYVTYTQFAAISHDDIYDFCSPYSLILFDEAHHTGAKSYEKNVLRIIDNEGRSAKVFGMTTHTKRYSDAAEDVADTIFEGHRINGISFEDAIKEGLLPQFDYITALYSLPKDIGDLVASSSLAKKIVTDSHLVQVNEEGIKQIIKKHMPDGGRKVVYFIPSIEDSEDAEKMAKELGYGKVYAINYTKSDKENHEALKAYNEAETASLVCISKFNEGAIPKGTNTVVVLRRTTMINIFERQVLTALWSSKEKPIVYDFVSNIDNLIYSKKKNNSEAAGYYTERIKSLCSQSIVVDYARQWTTIFNKLRSLNHTGWTEHQDEMLRTFYPKYGKDVYKYIKGHNMKDCILRAEVLGIEYTEKAQEVKKAPKKPYTLSVDGIIKSLWKNEDAFEGLTEKQMIRVSDAYEKTLDTGRIDARSISRVDLDKEGARDSLLRLAHALIKGTEIKDKNPEIRKRQIVFRAYIEDYAGYEKKDPSSVVIIDGKVKTDITKKELDRHLTEKKFEKKKDRMVMLEDRYMDKKRGVAGQYGETVAEHSLYRLYYKLLMTGYDEKRGINVKQFLQEYTIDEIKEKIETLRNNENAWTKADINAIKTAGKDPEDLYKRLVIEHSDLDILKMAGETDNLRAISFCTKRTKTFDSSYGIFLTLLEKEQEKINAEKERKRQLKEREEENKRRKAENAERLRNLKPTVFVVPRKKKK